jgi:hypothetical protein
VHFAKQNELVGMIGLQLCRAKLICGTEPNRPSGDRCLCRTKRFLPEGLAFDFAEQSQFAGLSFRLFGLGASIWHFAE